jgi:hypothetical protein
MGTTTMKTNRTKLKKAEAAIKAGKWLEYVQIGHPAVVLQIDYRLLPILGHYLEDGEMGVGKELAAHYRIAIQRKGQPVENPAQLELFLTFKDNPPVTVFICSINGAVYISSEMMMPF